jgi:hypothetical protein
MLTEALASLASAGGLALVQAAATDVWGAVRAGVVKLLGHGEAGRGRVIEGRLDETAAELAPLAGGDLEAAQERLAQAWRLRFADLLEEDADAAEGLRRIIAELAAAGVPAAVSAAGRGVAAGGNVSISASHGSVAAASIDGGVSIGVNPPPPGQATA